MLSFLSKLGSPSTSNSSPRRDTSASDLSSWSAAFASDPTQWEATFEACWSKVHALLEKKEYDVEHIISYDEMTMVLSQLTQMTQLLMMEVNSQPEPAIGPILDKFFTQQIMERILDWAIQIADFHKPICQLSLIRIYEGIVGESHTQNHCLLVHKPILNPLLRLFEWCKRVDIPRRPNTQGQPTARDKHFVLLLNQICTKLAEDRTLLHFFFSCSEGSNQFVVFSLLIPFLYEQNDVGQLARDALLLILSVSSNHEGIAEFVALKSAFCPVVATGLSGCFSQLPRILAPEGSDSLVPDHANDVLANFQSSVVFCNAVVQAAHNSVIDQICSFFYSGFLLPVVKPALLRDEREAAAASTAYLKLCAESVTEIPLLRTVIKMLLIEKDDEQRPLIETIVYRIKGSDRLATISLQLLDCLLTIGCEDLMLVLVFRYLLPLRHTTRKQMARIRTATYTSDAAQKILECIPESLLKFTEICSNDILDVYINEGMDMVKQRALSSSSWKWRYDGVHPSPQLFRVDSDDEATSTFSRLSSCRSSMSNAAVGLNRYFTSKRSHLTAESNYDGNLVELGGAPDDRSLDGFESFLEPDDEEFVLPTVSHSSIMTSSMVDYFQLAAFEDTSGSEDMPSSPDRKLVKEVRRLAAADSLSLPSESESSAPNTGRGFDTDIEMARSFVLSGWADVKDMDTFLSLLDRQPLPKAVAKMSIAECNALIDSKIQYWKEMDSEDTTKEDTEPKEKQEESKIPIHGQPIEEGADSSLLLETLLYQLESCWDHPLSYNLQLTNVLLSLASYPQPILAAFLFDVHSSDRFPRLIEILSSVKRRIDALMSGIEKVDVLINRAYRALNAKSDRTERHNGAHTDSPNGPPRGSESPKDESPISSFLRGRPFGASFKRNPGIRYHIHKAVETVESARDDERTRNIVHSAIVMANLCQALAGIVLQHSLVVVNHQNS